LSIHDVYDNLDNLEGEVLSVLVDSSEFVVQIEPIIFNS